MRSGSNSSVPSGHLFLPRGFHATMIASLSEVWEAVYCTVCFDIRMLLDRILFPNSRNSYYSFKISRSMVKDCTFFSVDTFAFKCSIFCQGCVFHS